MSNYNRAFGAATILLVCGPLVVRGDTTAIIQILPAEIPINIVVDDFASLDRVVGEISRKLDPEGEGPSMLADVKGELAIGDWIDFSKPFAMALSGSDNDDTSLFCAVVPDFAKKAKEFEGAIESDGIWKFPLTHGESPTFLYAKQKGDYVLGSKTESVLKMALESKKPLAGALQSRGKLLGDRDVSVHIDMSALRPKTLAGIAQMAQMAPMLAMMVSQQMGNPQTATGMIMAVVDSITKFVEQLEYIDIGANVTNTAIDTTIATGFTKGPIGQYLAKQKPASMEFFTEIADSPYFALVGFHLPGDESPVFDYIINKAMAAVPAVENVAEGEEGGDAPKTDPKADPTAELLKTSLEFYKYVEGVNALIALTPEGIRENGDFLTKSPGSMLKLVGKMISSYKPVMQQFGIAGTSFEALGTKEIAGTTVESYAVKLDPNDPTAAQMAGMYGQDMRLAFGETNGRVRFHLGQEKDMAQTFAAKVASPISASSFVKSALASLPAKKNIVALIDPAGILSLFGAMTGMPAAAPIPPGPPFAISVLLSEGPARIDIHVPVRTIERIKQAMAPDEPM